MEKMSYYVPKEENQNIDEHSKSTVICYYYQRFIDEETEEQRD